MDFINLKYVLIHLLYEGNPMAYIIEEAGGIVSNGKIPILDIQPTALH